MSGVIDFSVYNLDSIFWSVLLGVVGAFVLWRSARAATSGVPGRFQAAVEILFEMVDTQARGIVHNAQSRKLVSPLALTVFVWIFLLNSMDFLPVDLFHKLFEWTGLDHSIHYFRVVPTADLSSNAEIFDFEGDFCQRLGKRHFDSQDDFAPDHQFRQPAKRRPRRRTRIETGVFFRDEANVHDEDEVQPVTRERQRAPEL